MTPRLKGLTFIAISAFCFAVMSVLAKMVTTPAASGADFAVAPWLSSLPIPAAEALFVRSVLGWLGLLAVARLLRAEGTRENPRLLVLRGIFGGLATLCYFVAIENTQLSTAALIGYAYPVFSILFAWVFLRERLGAAAAGLAALAIIGVATMIGPEQASGGRPGAAPHAALGNAAALLGSICSGAAIATLRRLRRDEATLTVVLHFTFWCSVVSLPAAVAAGPVMPNATQASLLAVLTAFAATGQLLLTAGYRDCSTSEGSTMSLLNGLFTVAFGMLLFREALAWTTWVGAGVTLGACAALAWTGRTDAH